jgi:hypothetical protein
VIPAGHRPSDSGTQAVIGQDRSLIETLQEQGAATLLLSPHHD